MSKLAQVAYEQIRARIVSGEWTTDTPLSEPALARTLQVSRTPVREAIRRLQSEGLLEQRHGHGTFVRSLTRKEMLELFQIRILLEPFAAARAARKRSPELLGVLTRLVAEMKRLLRRLEKKLPPDEEARVRSQHRAADRAFHSAILEEAGNGSLKKIVDGIGILSVTMKSPVEHPRDLVRALRTMDRYHARILAAIRRGDADLARRTIRDHLVAARRRWGLRYLAWLEEQG